jgi:UDP-glucose 4-epimerase
MKGLDVDSFRNSQKRIVVLGKNGFIGKSLIEQLVDLNLDFLALGRDDLDLLAPTAESDLVQIIRPNDAVVLAAAFVPVKNVQMLSENIRILETLSNAFSIIDFNQLINVSSDAVYPDLDYPLDEDVNPSPTSLHGVMHLAREVCFSQLQHLSVCHIRPTLVFGSNDPHNGYGPNRFVREARKFKSISIFGEGEERRDHIYVKDVARLLLESLVTNQKGILNAVSGSLTSFHELARIISELSENEAQIIRSPRQIPIPHGGYREFNNKKVYELFPDFSFTNLSDALAEMILAESDRKYS